MCFWFPKLYCFCLRELSFFWDCCEGCVVFGFTAVYVFDVDDDDDDDDDDEISDVVLFVVNFNLLLIKVVLP